jgi:hypothetical protein
VGRDGFDSRFIASLVEGLDGIRIKRFGTPLIGILGEKLNDIAADLLAPPEGLGNPPGDGQVGP